ncbi:FBD-associated F-box protein At1g66310-like, partial [Triticum urartu]|uniref:FBD-associated F-box protein At1g66310-like n=1 Tax=Triticum urartu TaxID=4572 RepID=UPI002044497B
MEEAAVVKMGRSEHHDDMADACGSPPSFRMEDLPAEVQAIIISLLPLKEVVRSCVVSTSWRMVWRFHCNLCFDGLTSLDWDTDDEFKGTTKIRQAKFIETINWVIRQHSGIGINKFSIRCGLHKEDSDNLDKWIEFAATSKAKIIAFSLVIIDYPFEFHHFPLEVLGTQGSSFVRSLFLTGVSIKPHSGIYGFTVLRKLVLKCVQIFGDIPGFLANCWALEDLEMIKCFGVTNLSIPHQLDKLQHLLVKKMDVETIECLAADLAHFEYKGKEIPIVFNGRSKLEKATIMFEGRNGLARVFTMVPIILRVKMLNVQARISANEQ